MILVNWGNKTKEVTDITLDYCNICQRPTPFEIRYEKKTAGAFFISLASWDKKYYLVCHRCSNGFLIKNEAVQNKLLEYSEAPSIEKSAEIFKKIEKEFIDGNYMTIEKIDSFKSDMHNKLKNDYSDKDINYVLSVFDSLVLHESAKQL